jgi:TRAP-type transport system periplasmic protein
MKKYKIFMLMFIFIFFYFVNLNTIASSNIMLNFGHMGTTDTAYHEVALFMADRISELTNGEIDVEVYPNAELGDEQDLFEQLMQGITDFAIVNPGVTVEFAPTMNFFSFPFLFQSHEEWERVLTSTIAEKIQERVKDESNVLILGYIGGGERYVVSKKPITNIDGFKNFLMRLAPSPIEVDTWSSLGVKPTVVNYSEIYSALQLGVIDGLENEPEWILRMKFYEQAPYLIKTSHNIVTRPIVMSNLSFEKLSKEHQQAILKSAEEASKLGRELGIKLDKESLEILIDKYGVTVFQVDIDEIKEIISTIIESKAEELGIQDLILEVEKFK